MFDIQTESKDIAIATMVTLWVFKCRDVNKSPAMGLKTWDYLSSSIKNAAIPSRKINDYIEFLSKKLISNPNPKIWVSLLDEKATIQRVKNDGTIFEFMEDQTKPLLQFESPENLIAKYKAEGVTERTILNACRQYQQVISTFVRVKHEETKLLDKLVEVE